MRSIFKLVRRFVATLMLSLLILLVLNIVLFLVWRRWGWTP